MPINKNSVRKVLQKRKIINGMAQKKILETFPKLETFFLKTDRDVNNLFKKSTVGFFGSSELVNLFELFLAVDLKSYWSFVDLGSGDGRIVFLASLFTSSYGIEKDRELYKLSLRRKEEVSSLLLSPVELINKDFYSEKLDGYGLVFINPPFPFYQDGFEEFLCRHKATYLIDITLFEPRFLKKKKEFMFGVRKFGLYGME